MINTIKRIELTLIYFLTFSTSYLFGQVIPIDTAHWNIQANSYVIENYKGKQAIYLQGGSISLKDVEFLNGTIEYDLYLKDNQAFPGVFFRSQTTTSDAEQFYVRPHQSGNPDATQAAASIRGLTPWQLYHGPKYSFAYEYDFDRWTHVKILVADDKAQVFLDYAKEPHLSWNLFHPTQEGKIFLNGGNRTGMHIADIKVDHIKPELINFSPNAKAPIENLIEEWQISDKFNESELKDPKSLKDIISNATWQGNLAIEEGTAINISRIHSLNNGQDGNTVFAKVEIESDKDQVKLFEFGYSDRVVAILNGQPIYKGTNRFRSRDYRYLGTIGLFDAIYLPLKKGKNTLLMAVSEDFGGWLITGRFADNEGIQIAKPKS